MNASDISKKDYVTDVTSQDIFHETVPLEEVEAEVEEVSEDHLEGKEATCVHASLKKNLKICWKLCPVKRRDRL
jgi:uncharacterized protein (DUF2267 family)